MCRKTVMMLLLIVMLCLTGSANAYNYYWCSTTGDWSNSGIWSGGAPSSAVEGAAFLLGSPTVSISTAGQGAWDCAVGYDNGNAVLNLSSGIGWTVTWILKVGDSTNGSGVFNVYGAASSKGLQVGSRANTTGTINVYNGGTLTVGTSGCTVGAGGTARINLIDGCMTVDGTFTISSLGCIDLQAGYLKVSGDQVSLLSGYISNGRITAYNGAGAVATPVYQLFASKLFSVSFFLFSIDDKVSFLLSPTFPL